MNPEPVWPDIEAICAVAAEGMADHGHEFQVRDRVALDNLLGRVRQYFEYSPDSNISMLAAILLESVTQAYVLVDGNNRLGFIFAYVFLRLNGLVLDMRETGEGSAHEMVIALVEKRLDIKQVADVLSGNCHPG